MNQHLADGFTTRAATRKDGGLVSELWNQRSQAIRAERNSTPERVLSIWDHPKFDLRTDSRLIFSPNGQLVGYAHVRDVKTPPVDVFAGYSVHPDCENNRWLWNDLFQWMETTARRVIPKAPDHARVVLVAGTLEDDQVEQRELERLGFEHNRTFHWMQIDFGAAAGPAQTLQPACWPDSIRIRHVVPGEDDVKLVSAYVDAFADHYGIVRQPFETELKEWRDLMQQDDFDASLWFVAHVIEDDSIAGLCTCYPKSNRDPERGMISDLGVRLAWRRRGIGQALLAHAFTELQKRGIKGAALNVDTGSRSGAPALYERAGMRSVRASHTYIRELRPGVNLVPQ